LRKTNWRGWRRLPCSSICPKDAEKRLRIEEDPWGEWRGGERKRGSV